MEDGSDIVEGSFPDLDLQSNLGFPTLMYPDMSWIRVCGISAVITSVQSII